MGYQTLYVPYSPFTIDAFARLDILTAQAILQQALLPLSDHKILALRAVRCAALFPNFERVYAALTRPRFGIARRLIGVSWELLGLVERIPFLCD